MASIRPRSISEYAQMLWRRKLLFLAVAGATMIAAFVIINRLPDIYESRASVVVTSKMEDRQSIADRVAAARERLSSRAHLEAIARRHLFASETPSNGALEGAVNRLRKETKVETQFRGDFPERLTMSYRNSDPQAARDIATDLVAIFGSMNEALEKQMAGEAESLNAELNDIESRLSSLSARRSARRSLGGGGPRLDVNAIRAERNAASSSIETLTDKQFSLEREIAAQKQQIAEQQKIVKSAPSEARSGSSYGVLLVRKAELQAQLNEFSTQYTDKNPKVIQARAQLDEINRQIAQMSTEGEGGGVANSAEARELRTLQRELGRMETELAITQRAIERKKQALDSTPNVRGLVASAPVAAAPTGDGTDVSEVIAGDDYDRLQHRYDSVLRQQERLQARRSTAAGLDPGLFQIVDHPSVPQVPVGPDRFKLLAMALALALALGLAAVVAFEAPRLFAIRDDRDVEYYLGAPVIVLIPETVSPSENGRTRRLLAMRVVGAVLLVAMLIPALFFLLNNLRVFQLLASR